MKRTGVQRLCAISVLTWTALTWRGGALWATEFRAAARERRADIMLALLTPLANLLAMGRLWSATRRPAADSEARLGRFALLVAWTGMVWAWRSRRVMGDAWSPRIEPCASALCTSGPYAVVRHPIYAGAIVFYSGVAGAVGDRLVAALCVSHVALFAVKAHVEDAFLMRHVPAYEAYARRTPGKLLPRVR